MAILKNTSIDDTGSFTLPSGTTAERPGTPESGFTRFNTDTKLVETYNGTNWISLVDEVRSPMSSSQTLKEAVGVDPILYYTSDDLESYSNDTVLSAASPWRNRGLWNTNYDLINDNRNVFNSSITKTTQNSRAAANFTGFCGLAFRNAAAFELVAANVAPTFTVAYVYGGGTSGATSDSSPVFTGNAGTTSFPPADVNQGGLFGYHAIGSFSGSLQHWYDNDGWVPVGVPPIANTNTNQWVHRVNAGFGSSWYGRTPSPFYNQTLSGGSLTTPGVYVAPISIGGIGHVRRVDSGTLTTTGILYEAVLWNTALTDEQIQNLRNFFMEKYPTLPEIGR